MIQPETLYDAYCLAHLQDQMNVATLLDTSPTMDFVRSNPSASPFKGVSSNDVKEIGDDVIGIIDDCGITFSAEIDTHVRDKDEESQEGNNKSLDYEEPVEAMYINEEVVSCVEEDTLANSSVNLSEVQNEYDADLKHDTGAVDLCAHHEDKLSTTFTIEVNEVQVPDNGEMPFSVMEMHQAAAIHEVLGTIEGSTATKCLQSEGQLLLYTDDKEFVEATGFGSNLLVMPLTNEKSNLVDDPYWTTLAFAIPVQLHLMLTSLAFSSNCNLLKMLPALVHDSSILKFQPKNFSAWRMKDGFNGPGYLHIWKNDVLTLGWSLVRSYDGFNGPGGLPQNHIGAFQFGLSFVRNYDGFDGPGRSMDRL